MGLVPDRGSRALRLGRAGSVPGPLAQMGARTPQRPLCQVGTYGRALAVPHRCARLRITPGGTQVGATGLAARSVIIAEMIGMARRSREYDSLERFLAARRTFDPKGSGDRLGRPPDSGAGRRDGDGVRRGG